MNNKKHIVNHEYFRQMLQICPKLPDQQFEELPFEEEILTFLRDLGHSGEIKVITDVNVNKLHQPWRSFCCGAEPLKTKASVKKKQVGSDKIKTPPTAKGKRLKTLAKAAKPAKKKQPTKTYKAKGITILSKVALTEAEQMELDTKRSLIQTHSSYTSGSGTDKGTGDKPRVLDIPTYGFDDEQISWKSSDEEDDDDVAMSDDDDNNDDDQNDDNTDNEGDDQDDDNEQTESDNDDDDIVHPKLSTFDEEQRKDEEDKE
ncbi:hypothetical protein Tco_1233568 [Tanacetum coccineum]